MCVYICVRVREAENEAEERREEEKDRQARNAWVLKNGETKSPQRRRSPQSRPYRGEKRGRENRGAMIQKEVARCDAEVEQK